MSDCSVYNATWAKAWSVPAESAPRIAEQMRGELFRTFNSPRTRSRTGTIRVFPDHLQRPGSLGMHLLESMRVDLTPLPKELQFLISSTACQHRTEFFGSGPRWVGMAGDARVIEQGLTIPRLVYYDGRAMYLGCCQGLGIAGGKYRHTEGEDIREDERGRARVRCTVPEGWGHVGLLAGKSLCGAAWYWPSTPGDPIEETWADLCEIRFARSMGWAVEVLEKVTWPEDRPLDLWAQRLSRLYLKAKQENNDALASCYRAICLHTIGRFHNLGYRDARAVVDPADPRATFDAIERVGPEGATIRTRERIDKPERECHPEWSSAIWSKTHLRVAKALMSVSRESVLAVRGDAIYLTVEPDWPDDGRCGVIRRKRSVGGPLPSPRNWADLKALTDGS